MHISRPLFLSILLTSGFTRASPIQINAAPTLPVGNTTESDLASAIIAAQAAAQAAATSKWKSQNWSGLVLNAPVGQRFMSVTGTFTVPIPHPPAGSKGAGQWVGAGWVGLDGTPDARISADVQLRNSLIQAGVVWIVKRDKKGRISRSYEPFTEWMPQTEQKIKGLPIAGGDKLTITCALNSPLHGHCSFYNHAHNTTRTIDFGAPDISAYIDGHSAEWIIEDTTIVSQPGIIQMILHKSAPPPEIEPFADYKRLEFFDTAAVDTAGSIHGLEGAREYELVDDRMRPMSHCNASGHFKMLCNYVRR